MSQTWKTIVIVIVTAIVVGGGVYFWQQNKTRISVPDSKQTQSNQINADKNSSATDKAPPDNGAAVLYQDSDYNIRFITSKSCAAFYSVKVVAGNMNELKNYGVFVPGSTSWPKDSPWYYYSLYTQSTYNKFNPDELPGKPEIKLRLRSGELLTWWSPQDGPSDAPNCGVEVEQL